MLKFAAGFLTALALTFAFSSHGDLRSLAHLNEAEIPWPALADLTDVDMSDEERAVRESARPLQEVLRWKTLIGTGGRFGEGLPDEDLAFGIGELGPGAIYPDHRHPTAELYYIISGSARWNVDGEEFEATPGSVVYMKPWPAPQS